MKSDDSAGKPEAKLRLFNPHETARAQSLAGTPLATFRQRFLAVALDAALISATYIPTASLLRYFIQERLHIHEDVYQSGHMQVKFDMQRLLEVAWTLWLVLYFGLFVWKTNGLTPGKRLLRIRILSLTHGRISFWQAVERAMGYGASALEGGFGFIQFFLNHNRLCTHDRIAETIVVQDPRTPKPPKD